MRSFKKILLSAVCVLFSFILFFAVLTVPYMHSEVNYYNDANARKELAGSLDMLICGSSHGVSAFDPKIIDGTLGCCSYNLSCINMTVSDICFLTEKEIERNPVKTVVLELHNGPYQNAAFQQPPRENRAEGGATMLARLDSFSEKVSYYFKNRLYTCPEYVSSLLLSNGVTFWLETIKGSGTNGVIREDKGFHTSPSVAVELTKEQAAEAYHTKEYDISADSKMTEEFDRFITNWLDKNINVIIVITPMSDTHYWLYRDYDTSFKWLKNYCNEKKLPIYDFSLLKNKNVLFPENDSFWDTTHLSTTGSQTFSRIFAETLLKVQNGEDVSDMFYSNYSEAEPYNIYNLK